MEKTFHEHRSSVMEAMPKRFRGTRDQERYRWALAADTGGSRETGSSELHAVGSKLGMPQ